jgi:hypothetical protein
MGVAPWTRGRRANNGKAFRGAMARSASGQLPKWLVPRPTRFDDVLREVGVPSEKAATHPKVRAWVKMWYRSRYVPEGILIELGLDPTKFDVMELRPERNKRGE